MPDEITLRPKRSLARKIPVLILLTGLVVAIFFLGTAEHRMMLAKIMVAVYFFLSGLFALAVLNNARHWQEELAIAEAQMDMMRDEVVLAATVARAQMAEARERLRKDPVKEQSELQAALFRQLMPLISMIVKKERSAVTWGITGFKLLRSLVGYLSRKG